MTGFAILLSFNLIGVILQRYAHVPLPGNVIGMILLLAALGIKLVRLHWIDDAASFLLRHMLLFFAPVIVSTLALGTLFRTEWPALLAVVVGSTLLTLLATAAVARALGVDER